MVKGTGLRMQVRVGSVYKAKDKEGAVILVQKGARR